MIGRTVNGVMKPAMTGISGRMTPAAPTVGAPAAGDGVLRTDIAFGAPGFEECDDGNQVATDACTDECWRALWATACVGATSRRARRGTEACDDGNANNGDGCSVDCAFEGVVTAWSTRGSPAMMETQSTPTLAATAAASLVAAMDSADGSRLRSRGLRSVRRRQRRLRRRLLERLPRGELWEQRRRPWRGLRRRPRPERRLHQPLPGRRLRGRSPTHRSG